MLATASLRAESPPSAPLGAVLRTRWCCDPSSASTTRRCTHDRGPDGRREGTTDLGGGRTTALRAARAVGPLDKGWARTATALLRAPHGCGGRHQACPLQLRGEPLRGDLLQLGGPLRLYRAARKGQERVISHSQGGRGRRTAHSQRQTAPAARPARGRQVQQLLQGASASVSLGSPSTWTPALCPSLCAPAARSQLVASGSWPSRHVACEAALLWLPWTPWRSREATVTPAAGAHASSLPNC